MDSTNKLIFFFLFFFSTTVFSSAQLSVDFKATSFQQLLKTNTGLLTSTKFTGRNIAGRAVYGLRTVPIAKAIVGNVLKNRAFSPWGVAITAAITSAGYFLNESTQEVESTQGSEGIYFNESGECRIFGQATTVETLTTCTTRVYAIHDPTTNTMTYSIHSSGTLIEFLKNGGLAAFFTPSPSVTPITDHNDFLGTESELLSDEQVYDSVVPNFSESDLSYALNDPQTGLPDEELTPLVDAASDLTNDYDSANDGDPNTNPTTDTENDTGDDTFTENLDQLQNEDIEEQQQSEQQDQCELTPDALGCQEFGDELTSVDIPVEEMTFSFNPVSLASDTSCPSSTVISLTFGDISLSNQPLCDFLTGINPVVIAVCSLLALYILTGGVQRG